MRYIYRYESSAGVILATRDLDFGNADEDVKGLLLHISSKEGKLKGILLTSTNTSADTRPQESSQN